MTMTTQSAPDVTLSLNVMNKLRVMSRGDVGVTSDDLADAIIYERMKHPQKTFVNFMRGEVYKIVKSYFPYARRDTPIKLGSHAAPGPSTEHLHVKIIDKDALLIDVIGFLTANDLLSELSPALAARVREYLDA